MPPDHLPNHLQCTKSLRPIKSSPFRLTTSHGQTPVDGLSKAVCERCRAACDHKASTLRQWHPVPTAALATSDLMGMASITPQQGTRSPPQVAGEERVNLHCLLSHHLMQKRTSKVCSAISMHLLLCLLQGCFSPSRRSPCTLLHTVPLQPLGAAASAPKLPGAVQTSCPKKNHYWLYPTASGRYSPSPGFYCP